MAPESPEQPPTIQPDPQRTKALADVRFQSGLRGDQGSLDEAVTLYRQALGPRQDHPDRCGSLSNLAKALYTRFQTRHQQDDLTEAIALYRKAVDLAPELHPNRSIYIDSLATVLLTKFQTGGQQEDLDEAISLNRQALELRRGSHPEEFQSLNNLAVAQYTRFQRGGRQHDLDEVISSYKQAVNLQLRVPSHLIEMSLNNLGAALYARYQMRRQNEDLEDAILFRRRCMEFQSGSHPPNPNRATTLGNLTAALSTRFRTGGQQRDLDEVIILHTEILELQPGAHPNRSVSLSNAATALATRYQIAGQSQDLDDAIALYKQALALRARPHPSRWMTLSNLASAIYTRYEAGGGAEDLDEAILLHRESLEIQPESHPNQSYTFSNLAAALSARFHSRGHSDDLDEAITLHRRALELRPTPHSDRSVSLSNLGDALSAKYETTGQKSNLYEAISLHRQALELQGSSHPNQSMSLDSLALALTTKFERQGQLSDLDEAISLHLQALELRPVSHPGRHISLSNLAAALYIKFHAKGQHHDLDKAILLYGQVLELQAVSHPHRSATYTNLAGALCTRFVLRNERHDLNHAVVFYEQALALQLESHPKRPMTLNELAKTLCMTCDIGGDLDILDGAVDLHRQALALQLPTDPDRAMFVNDLATTLCARFRQGKQQGDLEEAITLQRQSLELHSPSKLDQSIFLNNLARTLRLRFETNTQQHNLDESVRLYRQALELQPVTHPDRARTLSNIADTLIARYEKGGCRDTECLENAMSAFSDAVQCPAQSSPHRFKTAWSWAISTDLHQHLSGVNAYRICLQALQKLTALRYLDTRERQESLVGGGHDGIAREAAQCAIRWGRLETAIEYLQAGQAILWTQVLQLRSPFDDLEDVAPDLGKRLRNTALTLEHGYSRDFIVDILDNHARMAREAKESEFQRLNDEWSRGLEEVRQMNGFEGFLQPPSFSTLQQAATEYPVVFLLSNKDRSDCLVMTSTNIFSRYGKRRNLVRTLADTEADIDAAASLLSAAEISHRETEERLKGKKGKPIPSDVAFKSVLKVLWEKVVQPVIKCLDLQKSENPSSRLQWCPTGLFTFLPIHAAGCYDSGDGTECASDYIISSYTPTAGSLLTPLTQQTYSNNTFEMLAVAEPGLMYTQKEVEVIAKRMPKECELVTLGTPGTPALVEDVYSRLATASIVHFACHGKQNRLMPLDGGLLLSDGRLMIWKIMQQSHPTGMLAFLGACETAMAAESSPDEAMSIGTSFLFSGFRNVVATMWKMADADGPAIAEVFYEELFKSTDTASGADTRPDFRKSAQALAIAVKKLRSNPGVAFHRWVPFIRQGQ